MKESKLLRAAVAMWLAACAGPASSVRGSHGRQPAEVTGEDACRDRKARMQGRNPTPKECLEKVGQGKLGEPITRAMQLGSEMHKLALQCARDT